MNKTEECAEYFRSVKAYKRIMEAIFEKLRRYGEVKGYAEIKNASSDECNAATEILDPKRAFSPPLLKFRLTDFEQGLRRTRFNGVSLIELTEAYFNTKIKTNKELKRETDTVKADFWEKIILENKNKPCENWLLEMKNNKNYGSRIIMALFSKSVSKAENTIKYVCTAVNNRDLSGCEPVRLAVLSAEITGDPHFFDRSFPAGKLLIKGLSFISGIDEDGHAEDIREIYSFFGIEPDDISSVAAAVGIHLYKKDGSEHPAYREFAVSGETALISMSNLQGIISADAEKKRVFVVENPMVFSALAPKAAENGECLVCTSGQIKLAGLRLLDMLAESGCKIFYAGDLDPEGLQIADRLAMRYKNGVVNLWRMSVDDYIHTEKSVILSEKRLKKLESLSSSELIKTAEILKKEKKSAYQELLIPKMLEDISKKKSENFVL